LRSLVLFRPRSLAAVSSKFNIRLQRSNEAAGVNPAARTGRHGGLESENRKASDNRKRLLAILVERANHTFAEDVKADAIEQP